MVPGYWLIVAFLMGAFVGGLMVTIHRVTTMARIREEFRAELEALTEAQAEADSKKEPVRAGQAWASPAPKSGDKPQQAA